MYIIPLRKARLLAALRWTAPVAPDVAPPSNDKPFGVLTKGFLHNSYSLLVRPACSSSVYHSIGSTDKTDAQGSRHLYSTRLLALMAMRAEVETDCAERLLKIDDMIEEEKSRHDTSI